MKYRKKPVVIEATQWHKNGDHPEDQSQDPRGPEHPLWEGSVVRYFRHPDVSGESACKHCRERMPEDKARHVLHDDCIAPFLDKLAAKKEAERQKKERAEFKARKEKAKTWSDHHADAQKAVNAMVRARDAGEPCISCQTPWKPDFQAGHYRSRGAAKNLALDSRNIHGQCVQCNLHRHGNGIDFRIGLVGRYGMAYVEAIEADNDPRHHSIDDLKAIRAAAIATTKQLKKEAA